MCIRDRLKNFELYAITVPISKYSGGFSPNTHGKKLCWTSPWRKSFDMYMKEVVRRVFPWRSVSHEELKSFELHAITVPISKYSGGFSPYIYWKKLCVWTNQKNSGWTSVDRSTKATLSTYNTWIHVSRLQKIYHFQSLKLRLTTKPLTVEAVDMQQGRDLMLDM